MILHASAVVAILLGEASRARLVAALDRPGPVAIGAPTALEATMVLTGRLGDDARTLLERLLDEADADVVPFGDVHRHAAVDAFELFGKGRHPAALNFGDCMTYAVARLAGQPVLCTGEDFARTDLDLVDW